MRQAEPDEDSRGCRERECPEERDARGEEDEVNRHLLAVQEQEQHDPDRRDTGDDERAAARGNAILNASLFVPGSCGALPIGQY